MQTPPDQPEPRRVGQLLRDARQARGYNLGDIERQTRIPRQYLQALEDDRFDALPAPVYARGFLRNYARFLGLDENEILLGLPLANPEPAAVLPSVRPARGTNLWAIAFTAFGLGLLIWAILFLRVFNVAGDIIDEITGGDDSPVASPIVTTPTPVPSCEELLSRQTLTPEEQQLFDAYRTDCDEIRGTEYESSEERDFFLGNCLTPPAG
jgi:cytoskeleton protein RodZ